MKQLSQLDASFLYLETEKSPMTVGGTFIFQNPADSEMTFSRIKAHIQSRLQTSPVFRRRLVEMPMDFDLPYWLEDPKFDIDNHVSCHHLSNGSLEELQIFAETEFGKSLDKSKPLWDAVFIDGLKEDGDFALMLRIHHSAIDGMAGEEIIVGLMDFNACPEELPLDTWKPEHFSGYRPLLAKRIRSSKGAGARMLALAKDAAGTVSRSVKLRTNETGIAPPFFFNSPRTPLNVIVSGERRLSHVHLPLDKIKQIKCSLENATVNDVALAICSGALKQFMENRNESIEQSLIAMTPVSTRALQDKSTENTFEGNSVSSMLVSLETKEEDTLQRFEKIHANARKAIQYNRTIEPESLLGQLPPMLTALSTRSLPKLGLSQLTKPIFNVVVTNVPGSRVPLYMDGAKLLSQSLAAPIYDGAGFTIAVTSYVNILTIGVNTTPGIMPEREEFQRLIQDAFSDLYEKACGKDVAIGTDVAIGSKEREILFNTTEVVLEGEVVLENRSAVSV